LSQKVVSFGVITLAIAGLLGLMVWGMLNRTPVTGKSGFTRVQKPAPEFTLPLFNGGEFTMYEHLGQPVVVNFWASWCPPCREEARTLERVWRAYNGDVVFVGIDIQDRESNARAYLDEFNVTYSNGLDVDGKITIDFGVIGLPVTFFVSKQGVVERRWVGAIKERKLVAWVDELVAGVEPSGEAEGENLEEFFTFDS